MVSLSQAGGALPRQVRAGTRTNGELLTVQRTARAATRDAQEFGTDPETAVRPVNGVTDRALAGEFEPVRCLKAPEVAALPDPLRRTLDGQRPACQMAFTSQQLPVTADGPLTRGR